MLSWECWLRADSTTRSVTTLPAGIVTPAEPWTGSFRVAVNRSPDLCVLVQIFDAVGRTANVVPEFTQIAQVVNGASELMIEVFGEAGAHTRTAVGVAMMPYNAAIEVEAQFLLR